MGNDTPNPDTITQLGERRRVEAKESLLGNWERARNIEPKLSEEDIEREINQVRATRQIQKANAENA